MRYNNNFESHRNARINTTFDKNNETYTAHLGNDTTVSFSGSTAEEAEASLLKHLVEQNQPVTVGTVNLKK